MTQPHPPAHPREVPVGPLPEFENGEQLDQPTFHARYEAMPAGTRAELIGGEVFMPSPMKRPHSLATWVGARCLMAYEDATPGTESHGGVTSILGPESEPQPDLALLILPEAGGQVTFKDGYVVGPPELIIEVAAATESIDLHRKKVDYERYGVLEYVVIALRQKRVFWFVLQEETFVERSFDADGLIRSTVFPGLWLDPVALLTEDKARARAAMERGLATPEHAAFVAELARRRAAPSP